MTNPFVMVNYSGSNITLQNGGTSSFTTSRIQTTGGNAFTLNGTNSVTVASGNLIYLCFVILIPNPILKRGVNATSITLSYHTTTYNNGNQGPLTGAFDNT